MKNNTHLHKIIFHYPGKLVFGPESLQEMAEDYLNLGLSRLFVLIVPDVMSQLSPFLDYLKLKGISIKINMNINDEPSFNDFKENLEKARSFKADSIAGIGGGSVMDVAKIIAALLYSQQQIETVTGNGIIKERNTCLICVPTTSGTGSEVSPNAILLDETDGLKKGIISPYLVPDAVYIDPALTLSLPPLVSAYTGIDALTHCIEAYTNRFAHPMTDTLALDGIRYIGRNLKKAVDNGKDLKARSEVAIGSMFGGMCLGPVNTAAVHALAYPIAGNFKIAHGLSNALLLPYVMEFNMPADEERYAAVAMALGIKKEKTHSQTAKKGISFIRKLINECKLPSRLSEIGIPHHALLKMAKSAMKIQRLLNNNIREITLNDALTIYETAY